MVSNAQPGRSARSGGPAQAGDYRVLVATLQAVQLATPAARASAMPATAPAQSGSDTPLLDILDGSPRWEDAVVRLGGSFRPGRGDEER